MPDAYKELLKHNILHEETFLRALFSGHKKGEPLLWLKVTIRPVIIKGQTHLQFCYYDSQKSTIKNYSGNKVIEPMDQLLRLPFKNMHIEMAGEEIQINISKKGKALIQRHKKDAPQSPADLSHNRQKKLILPSDKPDPYLQSVGIMNSEGKIKADKQKKFRQVNEFLKLIEQTGELERFGKPLLTVIDYGCGNAYLTFAVYHYLNHILGLPAQIIGVDARPDPLEKHTQSAQALGWDKLIFQASTINEFVPPAPPDITLALHACDTATDDALANGIRWRSKLIISVPCCHHHIQQQLSRQTTPEPFRPMLRHGILAERFGDVLTDTFRALILRIMGYQTEVLQFISAEHTAKNIMIRSVRLDMPAPQRFIQEYKKLKQYWQVTPYLEQLLGESFLERLDQSNSDDEQSVEMNYS